MAKHPKTILITGASSGIGEALALAYAQKGYNLVLTGRNQGRLDTVVEACKDKGAAYVMAKIIDVRDGIAMASWLESVLKELFIDVVIANAGISGGTSGLPPEDIFDQSAAIFDVNVMGVLNTINPVYKHMQAEGHGHIALVSSLASYSIWTGAPAYATSKTAVRILGYSVRPFLKKQGIDMTVICPGFVTSRMTDKNDYAMPLKMSAEDAAHIIVKKMERKQKLIAFPLRLYALVRILGIIPNQFISLITSKLPSKKSL